MTGIRPARPTDAEDMAEVQNAIYRAGLRASPVDVALIRERYLDTEHTVACTVAVQEGTVVGFQSLKQAWPGNPYDVTEGWGIIGTHIHPDAGRQGLGRRLFTTSLAAAKAAAYRRHHRRRQPACSGLLLSHGLHAVPRGQRRHPAPFRRLIVVTDDTAVTPVRRTVRPATDHPWSSPSVRTIPDRQAACCSSRSCGLICGSHCPARCQLRRSTLMSDQ